MPFAETKALEHAMGELLSVMRESAAKPEQLRAAWNRCAEAGVAVSALVERGGERTEGERLELRRALEQLLRLNAVAKQAVVEEQRSLTANLDRARSASKRLRGYSPGASKSTQPGSSCDVAG